MAESRGMSIIRVNDTSIMFRAVLFDAADNKITDAVTDANIRIWHVVPATGALEAYDFNDDTFKAVAVVTATASMDYQVVIDPGPVNYDTGVWTYRHATLTDFELGDKYIAEVDHTDLPRPITMEFQYGDGDEWVAHRGTAAGGGANYILLEAATADAVNDDIYQGQMVHIVSGTGVGQTRPILTYDATGHAGGERYAEVVRAWTVNPDNTSRYILIPEDVYGQSDVVWDEDIVAAHGTADTSGLLLRALGADIAGRAFNTTLNDLLGVPDTALTDTVAGQVWEELLASHNTVNTMGEVMNNLVAWGFPTAAVIADAVWDEDIVAAHGGADTAGLLLRVLGEDISTRVNNATLNDLLGVPDVAATNLPDAVWDEDIVAAHGTADTAGLLLRVLGADISTRANNATLNDLLGVVDVATATIAWAVLDEVVDAATHNTPDSVGERLYALDILLEAGGAGDAAEIHDQAMKMDQSALLDSTDPAYDADSVAGKLDSIIDTLDLVDRDLKISINLQGVDLRIETCQEQYGVVQTVPWTQCSAQIFDESNGIVANIGVADFGAITGRGFFQYTLTPHPLVAGHTYQIEVTLDDGVGGTFQNTKLFKVINV